MREFEEIYRILNFKDDTSVKIIDYENTINKYKKNGYYLSSKKEEFIKLVVNERINYTVNNEKNFIDFNHLKVLKDYPTIMIKRYEEKFQLKGIIPIAENFNGYMLIFFDENDFVYGIFDNLLILYGRSIEEGIINIINNKEIKKLSE